MARPSKFGSPYRSVLVQCPEKYAIHVSSVAEACRMTKARQDELTSLCERQLEGSGAALWASRELVMRRDKILPRQAVRRPSPGDCPAVPDASFQRRRSLSALCHVIAVS